MAFSSLCENPHFRYDVMSKVWFGYLREDDESGQLSRIAGKYFGNFIRNHKNFEFSVVKIYDDTKHLMVDREQYEMIKNELEKKTKETLPDIYRPTDTNNVLNVIEGTRIYKSQQQYKKHVSDLKNSNEARIRQNAEEQSKKLCQLLSDEGDTNYLAIDLEVYENDFKTILEIGYVKFNLKDGDKPEYFHAIVNEDLHNQEDFDNRDEFKFGTTERMTLKKAAEQLQKEIAGSDALVTHSSYNVYQYLVDNKIAIAEKPLFDTQLLELHFLPTGSKCWGLKKLLGKLHIDHDQSLLNNAGNDAHYIMLAFNALVKRAIPDSPNEAAASTQLGNPHYRYDIMKKVWLGYLKRHHSSSVSQAGGKYFTNFIKNHRNFQFCVVKIFDDTKHLMVDRRQYEQMKNELEIETKVDLPVIDPTNMSDPKNVIEGKRVYKDKRQFITHIKDLMSGNTITQERVCENAAQHTDELCEMLSDQPDLEFLSFDLEVHDEDFTTILEIGYVKFTLKEGDKPEYFHAIVNEELHNQEGFDNKEKFGFGTSERMTLEEAAEQLKIAVDGSNALVAHSGQNDLQFLVENDIIIAERMMFDTQMLGLDLLPKGPKCWGLKKMLSKMNIAYDGNILHNAGNDAHYTMLAFKALVKRAMTDTES